MFSEKDRRRKGVFDVHMACDDGETLTNVDEDPDQVRYSLLEHSLSI